jgi:hypothetical protein
MTMNKGDQFSQEVLLSYLDGTLDSVQRDAVEKALGADPTLSKKLEELRSVDKLLRKTRLEQPSKTFTASVLQRLDDYPLRRGLSIRNGIFLLTGIMVIIAVALALLSMGVFDQTTTTLNPNEIDLVQKYSPKNLPSVSIDGKMMVNIIVILNLAVMFIVLDRAILKPFFERRIHSH